MKKFIFVLLITIFISGCGLINQERVLDARDYIQEKEYRSAIKTLNKVHGDVAKMTKDQKGEYYILRAQALKELERYEEAENALKKVSEVNPGSVFEAQAKALLIKWKRFFI